MRCLIVCPHIKVQALGTQTKVCNSEHSQLQRATWSLQHFGSQVHWHPQKFVHVWVCDIMSYVCVLIIYHRDSVWLIV